MRTRLFAIAALFAVVASGIAGAQDVKRTANNPSIDGSFGATEYVYTHDSQGIKFGASLSQDGSTLYLAVEAPTAGWVAIGLGTTVMNGSYIVMGADGGNPSVIEQMGQGHSHGSTASKVIKSSVKTTGSNTVLEFSLPAADFVKNGTLQVILAYGRSTDFRTRHVTHASLVLSVQ
ncbi:MAG TPA: DOMON domain-containing protein [Rectinemataceae bacterium]|nr:DOMON domain-containing protein [Rectinemataceae bacterium]